MTRTEFVDSIRMCHNIGNGLECIEPVHRTGLVCGPKMNVERKVTDVNGYHDFRISIRWPDDTYGCYYSFEEIWSNVETPPKFFSTLAENGIHAVRIPINLISHILDATTHEVDELWLDHIFNTVKLAINSGLKCILSLHTDFAIMNRSGSYLSLIDPNRDPAADGVARLMSVWKQLASYLDDFPTEDLAFELANEFQITDIEKNTSCEVLTSYAAELYRRLFSAIRDAGENSKKRFLIIGGYRNDIWYDIDQIINLISNELDENCILSSCFYTPWQFTVCNEASTWAYSDETKEQMDRHMSKLIEVRNSTDIPIIITEYGVGSDVEDMRAKDKLSICKYLYFMMKWFYDNNFSACIWDPGYLLHRNTMFYGIPFWKDMITSIINGAEFDIDAAYAKHKDNISFMRCTVQRSYTLEDIKALDNIGTSSEE